MNEHYVCRYTSILGRNCTEDCQIRPPTSLPRARSGIAGPLDIQIMFAMYGVSPAPGAVTLSPTRWIRGKFGVLLGPYAYRRRSVLQAFRQPRRSDTDALAAPVVGGRVWCSSARSSSRRFDRRPVPPSSTTPVPRDDHLCGSQPSSFTKGCKVHSRWSVPSLRSIPSAESEGELLVPVGYPEGCARCPAR